MNKLTKILNNFSNHSLSTALYVTTIILGIMFIGTKDVFCLNVASLSIIIAAVFRRIENCELYIKDLKDEIDKLKNK